MALILTGTSGSTTLDSSAGLTFSDSSNQAAAASPYVLKNRIINGDMRIAQRATTASNVGSSAYATLDRFVLDTRINASPTGSYTQAQSTDAPTGFNYSFSVTVSTAGNSLASAYGLNLGHFIEGYNIADLGWGTANAQTITLSFWVKSSITGSYGFGLMNASYGAAYVAQYTVTSANTWEKKTVTIPGPTIGTWDSTTGRGIQLKFSLGTGSTYVTSTPNTWIVGEFLDASSSTASPTFWNTSGAVWKITGVQLELGSTATPFERRLYGQELINCQRYFYVAVSGAQKAVCMASYQTSTYMEGVVNFPVEMRTAPSLVVVTGTNYYSMYRSNAHDYVNSFLQEYQTTLCSTLYNTSEASGTTGNAGWILSENASGKISFSAEL
jgi:hypothetical protein